MKDKHVEWADIAYFSKGVINVSGSGPLVITVNEEMSPLKFAEKLVAAANEAESTLGALKTVEEKGDSFPNGVESRAQLDSATGKYYKAVSYIFNVKVPVENPE